MSSSAFREDSATIGGATSRSDSRDSRGGNTSPSITFTRPRHGSTASTTPGQGQTVLQRPQPASGGGGVGIISSATPSSRPLSLSGGDGTPTSHPLLLLPRQLSYRFSQYIPHAPVVAAASKGSSRMSTPRRWVVDHQQLPPTTTSIMIGGVAATPPPPQPPLQSHDTDDHALLGDDGPPEGSILEGNLSTSFSFGPRTGVLDTVIPKKPDIRALRLTTLDRGERVALLLGDTVGRVDYM